MSDTTWVRPFPPNKHLHFSPLRRVQQASDSDGKAYDILVQTEEMSCGVAAAVMIVDLYNAVCSSPSMVDTEARLKKVAAQFPGSLVESDKEWATGKEFGSTLSNIEKLLKSQNIPIASKASRFASKTATPPVLSIARLRTPAAILWGYYSNGKRTGGHFTVAAGATKRGDVVILDPWNGTLSEIRPTIPYQGNASLDAVLYTS